MRAAVVVLMALLAVASCANAFESATISEEVSAAEENDFAVVDMDTDEDQSAMEQDEEAGEFEAAIVDNSEDSEEDMAFMAVDEEVESESESESEDEELEAESDEAENEDDSEVESEDEEEVEAIDEDVVEEENADVFAEVATPQSELLQWLNLARAGDAKVVAELTRMSKLFQGKLYVDGTLRLQTNEGVKAVNEAIAFMKKYKPAGVSPLTQSVGLTKAAQAHAADVGKTTGISHTGSDGSDPFKRMNRFGTWGVTAGENIGTGYKTGKAMVMQYLIDDGVASRGHRTNVLKKEFKKVGLGFGAHKTYKFVNVCDFAGAYTEKP
jgi:uncharacterized protein YkwD